MSRAVHGINGLVLRQLEEVTWTCLNTHMRRVVLLLSTLVMLQLKKVTWKCSNMHVKSVTTLILKTFVVKQFEQDIRL